MYKNGIRRLGVRFGFLWLGALTTLLVSCSGRFSDAGKAASKAGMKARKSAVTVQVVKPERKDLVRKITLPGSLTAYEQATLYARAAGYLQSITVDKGDAVKKEAVLAVIEAPEVEKDREQAQAQYEEAKAHLEQAKADHEQAQAEHGLQEITYRRIKDVREQEPDVIPQQEVDVARGQFEVTRSKMGVAKSKIAAAEAKMNTLRAALERSATLVNYATLKAPFHGIITQRFVDTGALIQTVSPLVTIMNMDTLRLYLEVPEREVPFVRRGNTVTVTVDALPGRTFSGTVARFATALDPATRTMKTEVQIPNRDHTLRPGMYGHVAMELETHAHAITIPAGSLTVEGDKIFVFTVVNNQAKKVAVRSGYDDGTRVEILEGLSGHEDIILTKSGLTEGVEVKVVS
ncbi:MAG: efflux RND transporter periplasmic adaptor subunit [Acidobacteria bacterium]|nr:efflux RND transporter periplasmic adaptor subunit [Acidobacteriota bacterium]